MPAKTMVIPNTTEEWQKLGDNYEKAKAKETLEHSITELLEGGDVVFLTAFGPEGCVIFHMIYELIEEGRLNREQVIQSIKELKDYDEKQKLANLTKEIQISQMVSDNDDISQQIASIKPETISGNSSQNQAQHHKGKFIIANLDTGYQFKETLDLKEQLKEKYNLDTLLIEPRLSVEKQDEQYEKDLFKSDPDQCCYMRKLVPLTQLLYGRLAWITSIRREQTEFRKSAKAFEYDKKFHLGKINPLIHWTKSDVWKYIHENKIPYNPLLDQGYDSIGCEPCTSTGTDRKGRWAGQDKIECGLHIQDQEMSQGGEFTI